MSGKSRVLPALVVVILLAALTGCGGQLSIGQPTPMATTTTQVTPSSEAWDTSLDQARELEGENDALEAEVSDVLGKLQPLGKGQVTAKTVAAAVKAMKRGREIAGKAEENFASLQTLWGEMAVMDVSAGHTTYARQQKKIARLDARTAVLLDKYFATFLEMLRQWRTISQADALKLGKEAMGYMERGGKLQARIDALKQESEQYYNENVAQ